MRKGTDVIIDPTARITRPSHVEIGSHVGIDMGVYISTQAVIGDYIHIAPQVCIIGGYDATLIMEDFTNISAGAKLVVVSDSFREGMLNPIVPSKYRKLVGHRIVMRMFSVVGVNSVVMPNVEMAVGSALGANSTLLQSTEPWTVYAGSPAKAIGKRDKSLILQAAKELGYEDEIFGL